LEDSTEIVGIDVNLNERVRLRDRVERRRDFTEAHTDREHEIDMLERSLGGARTLWSEAPTDRERMTLVDDALSRDTRRHGRLQHFRQFHEVGGIVHAAQSRVNADPTFALGE